MTNLDSILKRHYFADKGQSSQSYVFPVVMYGCESWTMKKAALSSFSSLLALKN